MPAAGARIPRVAYQHIGGPMGDQAGRQPWARFDDLTESGESFELHDMVAELVAGDVAEVTTTIEAAERAGRNGHWVAGFVAYEAAPGFDPALRVRSHRCDHPMASLPHAWFGVFDRRVDVATVGSGQPSPVAWAQEWTRGEHADAVGRVKDRIAAGDTYQLNLTGRSSTTVADPLALYAAMACAQGGAHNAFIRTGAHAIACASPELFFVLCGNRIVTRPMKGTARRGRWPAEDTGVARALVDSSKERAENVMIVDLLRNDIGRLAVPGSVLVPALVDVERYPTVWQLTSTVSGELRPGTRLTDVFGALFPSGSVTGAPKARTMELIADLELSPRGVYCGAVGVIAPTDGPCHARFAVAIRTATVDLGSGYAEYGTGGGITWPSDPTAEWDELLAKTAILDRPPVPGGLFETIRLDPLRGARHLDLHLARMAASAAYFGMAFDDAAVRGAIGRIPTPPAQAQRVRLTLSRAGEVTAVAGPAPGPGAGPVRLALSGLPVRSDDAWLFHKTTDRAPYDSRRAAFPDADDVVLSNERGHATETTIANLAVDLDGQWCTPTADSGLLCGIERTLLVERGVLRERVITIDELRRAPRLAVVSSLRGWREAVLVT